MSLLPAPYPRTGCVMSRCPHCQQRFANETLELSTLRMFRCFSCGQMWGETRIVSGHEPQPEPSPDDRN